MNVKNLLLQYKYRLLFGIFGILVNICLIFLFLFISKINFFELAIVLYYLSTIPIILIIFFYVGYRKDAKNINILNSQYFSIPIWVELTGLLFGSIIGYFFGTFSAFAFYKPFDYSKPYSSNSSFYTPYINDVAIIIFSYLGIKLLQLIWSLMVRKYQTKNFRAFFILVIVLIPVIFFTNFLVKQNVVKLSTITEEREKISVSNFYESNPSLIQQTYPTERVNVGGTLYNATQLTITADLYLPKEQDYEITSSFDHTGALTTIDNKEGQSYQSTFHLTEGFHKMVITYIVAGCLPADYLKETYGTEAKPQEISIAIRTEKYGNPVEFRHQSKPFKKQDFYLHCTE